MLVAQNSLGPVCPVPLTVRGNCYDKIQMIQSLTKPQEGETAGESIQIALAASAPNGNNTLRPI